MDAFQHAASAASAGLGVVRAHWLRLGADQSRKSLGRLLTARADLLRRPRRDDDGAFLSPFVIVFQDLRQRYCSLVNTPFSLAQAKDRPDVIPPLRLICDARVRIVMVAVCVW